jgi:hypothetical protein
MMAAFHPYRRIAGKAHEHRHRQAENIKDTQAKWASEQNILSVNIAKEQRRPPSRKNWRYAYHRHLKHSHTTVVPK